LELHKKENVTESPSNCNTSGKIILIYVLDKEKKEVATRNLLINLRLIFLYAKLMGCFLIEKIDIFCIFSASLKGQNSKKKSFSMSKFLPLLTSKRKINFCEKEDCNKVEKRICMILIYFGNITRRKNFMIG